MQLCPLPQQLQHRITGLIVYVIACTEQQTAIAGASAQFCESLMCGELELGMVHLVEVGQV